MRLIDADRLKEYIDAQKGRPFIGCTIGEALKIMTDEQPTVDAVPVRCKDCKWWRDTDHTCKEHSLVSPMRAEEFCSRGERKDGDHDS